MERLLVHLVVQAVVTDIQPQQPYQVVILLQQIHHRVITVERLQLYLLEIFMEAVEVRVE
jgi:hypothetical protein